MPKNRKYKPTVIVPAYYTKVVGIQHSEDGKVLNKYGEELILIGYDTQDKPIYGVNK